MRVGLIGHTRLPRRGQHHGVLLSPLVLQHEMSESLDLQCQYQDENKLGGIQLASGMSNFSSELIVPAFLNYRYLDRSIEDTATMPLHVVTTIHCWDYKKRILDPVSLILVLPSQIHPD